MRAPREQRCSYVVLADRGDVRELAHYLSTLGTIGCDVVILDPDAHANARHLRWVGRHLRVPDGPFDVVRTATAVAACEKVIVATDDVRYTPEAVTKLCELLSTHEVVEPQDYLHPLPWWGGIDAARILLHRAIEPQPDHGATFGFRRSAGRRAEAYAATDVFVRREPRPFSDWLAARPRVASEDFTLPIKTAFFLSLVPMLLLLAILGGLQLASGYAGAIAFASVALAVRGRYGAGSFFPLRACLFAPLWLFERSLSVYWALYRKLRDLDSDPGRLRASLREPGNLVRDAVQLDDVSPGSERR